MLVDEVLAVAQSGGFVQDRARKRFIGPGEGAMTCRVLVGYLSGTCGVTCRVSARAACARVDARTSTLGRKIAMVKPSATHLGSE
jgi:hypothetical protein